MGLSLYLLEYLIKKFFISNMLPDNLQQLSYMASLDMQYIHMGLSIDKMRLQNMKDRIGQK